MKSKVNRIKKENKKAQKTVKKVKRKPKKKAAVKVREADKVKKYMKKEVVEQKKKDNVKDRVVFAKEKYINMSPRKARLVIDLVRGRNAIKAVNDLFFVRKRAALPIRKAIESAISNAVNNFEMDKKKLVISEAFIDKAPTYKRGRAGSRGRYKKILKRNCHITIGVIDK